MWKTLVQRVKIPSAPHNMCSKTCFSSRQKFLYGRWLVGSLYTPRESSSKSKKCISQTPYRLRLRYLSKYAHDLFPELHQASILKVFWHHKGPLALVLLSYRRKIEGECVCNSAREELLTSGIPLVPRVVPPTAAAMIRHFLDICPFLCWRGNVLPLILSFNILGLRLTLSLLLC